MSNLIESYDPNHIDIPAEDICTRLGITIREINASWKAHRDTAEMKSLMVANTLVFDVVQQAFLHVSNGGEQLSQSESLDLLKKSLEHGWFRNNMLRHTSQDELFRDERLCSLLAQAGEMAVDGFSTGLWKDETPGATK